MYSKNQKRLSNKRGTIRNKMYKLICATMLSIFFLASFTIQILAEEDEITSIKIEAALSENGSAAITEVWDIVGVSGGTEYYKRLEDMGDMTITSLQVWDETGRQYDTLDTWNVDWSLEEKANKCGIVKNGDSYEICWGISSYADHTYTVSYIIEGFVKSYTDYSGFCHQFISSDLSSSPKFVEVEIYMEGTAFSLDNSRIWGLDYEGEIEFRENGSIVAKAENGVSDGEALRVMCRFENALFPLAPSDSGIFEEIQEEVLNGDKISTFTLIMILAVTAVIIIGVCILVYQLSKVQLSDGTKVNIPSWKKVEVRSGLPFGGSLAAAYMAMFELKQGILSGSAIGAYLIIWETKKYIKIEEVPDKVKSKKQTAIIFLETAPNLDEPEAELYQILFQAATKEHVLSESRLQKWAKKNYQVLNDWEKNLKRCGTEELISLGKMEKTGKTHPRFNQSGMDQAIAMLGFKRYLKEYSAYYENIGGDTSLWGDYLAFAALFGISEQFIVDLEKSDPGYFDIYSYTYGYSSMSMIHMITMTNHISHTATAAISAADGGGGSAMSSGGGGFSGGGGGGSR